MLFICKHLEVSTVSTVSLLIRVTVDLVFLLTSAAVKSNFTHFTYCPNLAMQSTTKPVKTIV